MICLFAPIFRIKFFISEGTKLVELMRLEDIQFLIEFEITLGIKQMKADENQNSNDTVQNK